MKKQPFKVRYVVPAVVALLVLCFVGGHPADFYAVTVIFFLIGWILFLVRVLPEVAVSWPGVVTGVVSLAALAVGAHWFAGWLYREKSRIAVSPSAAPPRWRFAWTAAGIGGVVLMFVAGICFVGAVHQAIWLASSRLVERQGLTRSLQHESNGYLQQIGVAVREFERKFHRLPAATFSTAGRPLHSWQTAILPFTENRPLYDRIDHSAPWDAPVNHAAFHNVLRDYVLPGAHPPFDDRGYALSGYAANAYLLGGSRARRTSDITDGASQTILAGEAIGNPRPWGDPVNWRDPALGIHTSPDAFGGPWPAVTQFIFADGHTATLSNDIAPALFRALCTPDGGDDVSDELRQ
jgi:hypothetical protein